MALYLRHNCVPAPHTIYRGVAKLLPGQLVTVGTGVRPGGRPPTRAYWSARQAIEDARRQPLEGTAEAMADRLEEVLSDSVAARMVADVPVGAFLSGGIDSSLVVALMQQHSSAAGAHVHRGVRRPGLRRVGRGGRGGRPPREPTTRRST